MNFDVILELEKLSRIRPVFHNEKDFQFALAWNIQKQNPDSEIRLEYKVLGFIGRYTDIWIKDEKHPIAIELKYKPVSSVLTNNGEVFELKQQGAHDIGRYDFLKDVQRIEEIASKYSNVTGYAILLTNDHLYWNPPRKIDSIDKAFKIHEGKDIHGVLSWSEKAGKGTTKKREQSIIIEGTYKTNWSRYSSFNVTKGELRFLCVTINPQ